MTIHFHIGRVIATLFAPLFVSSLLVGAVAAADISEQELYANAKEEGNLVFYAGMPVPIIQKFVEVFKAKYPGINVEFLRQDTSSSVQRFEAEDASGRHVVDVLFLTDRQSKQLYKRDMIVPYCSRHLDLYPEELYGKDCAWSNYALTMASFAWNTDLVSADDIPKTWEDLLDPKWNNRTGMQDVMGGGGAPIWFVTMYEVLGEEVWTDFMQRLGSHRLRFGGYMQVQEMLASGEVAIHVAAYPNFIQPLKDRGAPVEWGTPSPIIWTGTSVNINKNAPHPNAARLLVDYMLSEETQALLGSLSMLPALRSEWSGDFKRLEGIPLYPQAHELETDRFDFFQGKKRDFFIR